MQQRKDKAGWTIAAIILLLIIIDQTIKILVKTHMSLFEVRDIFPWFKIYFTENQGMAFGMDFIGTWILALFRFVAVIAFCIYLRKLLKGGAKKGLIFCVALIIAGALGNILDNCFYGLVFTESFPSYYGSAPASLVGIGEGYGNFLNGRVVDMFYFPLFEWPTWMPIVGGRTFFGAIFNFADACVSCGAIALLLFYPKQIFRNDRGTNEDNNQEALQDSPANVQQ